MTGPRDEDLDDAFNDEWRHLEHYSYGLTTDEDRRELDRADEHDDDWLEAMHETYRQEHDNA